MQLDDYAPPASPSLEQQRDALQKGLGRVAQWAMTGRLQEGPLLEACLTDQRFDHQCEDMRGDWLWKMVQAVGAVNRFRVPVLHALHELNDERSARQLCELARCYGQMGDDAFRSRLYEIVEQKPFPNYCACIGEEEIFTLDGEQAFVFAARLRGASLAEREWDRYEDGRLIELAIERTGEERIGNLFDAATDKALCRFRDAWRADKERKAGQCPSRPYSERYATISAEEIIRTAEGERNGWFRGWGRQASDADLRIVLQRLWTEPKAEIIASLLRVFSGRPLPDFDGRLIELCKHANEAVRGRAFCALEQHTHPQIREFALIELKNGVRDAYLASLFINNYQQGDEQRILEALVLPGAACQRHWLLMDINKMFEKNSQADCSRLALISYAKNPCQNCRHDAARLLRNQQAAPAWLKEECQHDSDNDCRQLFAMNAGSINANEIK